MNTFQVLIENKLHNVNCNPAKLSRADQTALELINRAKYITSTLENILRDGGSQEDLDTLIHDFNHLKRLMERRLN